jgi:PmbA protein
MFNGAAEYPELALVDPGLAKMSLEDKIEMSREAEKAGRGYDPRVSIVERTGYDESRFSVVIMNTKGLSATSEAAYCSLFTSLVAEENGKAESGFSLQALRGPSGLVSADIGVEAAQRAVRMLGARSMNSARMPVILEPYVATSFLGLLGSAVNADSVQKGKSFLAGKVGQSAASPAITLVDDQLSSDAVGTFPFDGEGTPSQKTTILDKGTLKTYLYDTRTACKDDTRSTGNGMRGGFRSLPGVGTSNFYLAPGAKSQEELIGELEDGILITEVMGMHTANPISGDFSLGAAGIRIEHGKLSYPVRGITLAGNLVDLLRDIDEVGSDLRFMGTRGAPSLRLRVASIGGE